MEKIKIRMDHADLTYMESKISNYIEFDMLEDENVFYAYALADCLRALQKVLFRIMQNSFVSKMYQINLRRNEFKALYKFMACSNVMKKNNQMILFWAQLNQILVNLN